MRSFPFFGYSFRTVQAEAETFDKKANSNFLLDINQSTSSPLDDVDEVDEMVGVSVVPVLAELYVLPQASLVPYKGFQHGACSEIGTIRSIIPVPEHGTVSSCSSARS
jgi:hypothetical protein